MFKLLTGLLFSLFTTIAMACPLTATWESWQPYQYKDASANVTGLDNDLLMAIANEVGCAVSLKEMPWKRTLQSLENGSIHLTSAGSYTDERNKFAYFSEPYRDETVVAFVQKKRLGDFNFTDLSGLASSGISIGISRGYHYGEEFESLRKLGKIKGDVSEVAKDELNIKKLAAGRVDAIFMDRYVGADLIKSMGLADKLVAHPAEITSADVYFMFSRKSTNEGIVNQFNEGLKAIKANGKYQAIIDKYIN